MASFIDEQLKFSEIILDINNFSPLDAYKIKILYKNFNKKKCIIWFPGRNDYFYHYHITEILDDYDIYALFYSNNHEYKEDISDYFYDLKNIFDEIDVIYSHFDINNIYDEVILYGHSTGGLIITIYQIETKNKITKIILNSPFYAFKFNIYENIIFNKILYYIIPYIPEFDINQKSFNDNLYTLMLSKKYNIDNIYKKNYISPVISTWFRNIIKYQHKINNNKIKLKYDTLILYSDHYTKYPGDIKGDEVLDIESNSAAVSKLGDKAKLVFIKNAIHDVLSSNENSLNNAINIIIEFL
mgnify:CR=1 FL=1